MVRVARPVLLAVGLAAGLVLGGCGGGGAGAGSATPAATQGDSFAAVFRAVEQWRQGWEVRSLEALAPLYRQDAQLVIVHQGRPQRGWPAAQAWLRAQLAGATSVHLRLQDGAVTTLGDGGALFSARMGRDFSDGVITRSDDGFLTLTFARGDDGWQIVAEHYSFTSGP